LGYARCRGEPDVWLRPNGEGYDYIGTYTDDLLVVSHRVSQVFEELELFYTFKGNDRPSLHVGVDYIASELPNGKVKYQLGSFTYVKEAISKIELLLEEAGIPFHSTKVVSSPMHEKVEPELFDGDVCTAIEHTAYMQLIGIYQWIQSLGRVDIGFAVSSLSRFSALPRKQHLTLAVEILYFLRKFPDRRLPVDSTPMDLPKSDRLFSRTDPTAMRNLYQSAVEEIDPKFPKPHGKPIQTSIFFDANFAHDKVTRKSNEGFMLYLGRTLIKAKSKRQGSIASSTHVSEITAGRTASEEVMDFRYLLRSLALKIEDPTLVLGDNESSIRSVTDPSSPLNKRHIGVSYHTARECEAMGITKRYHVRSENNISDGLTKAMNGTKHYKDYKADGPVFCEPWEVKSCSTAT
jgi:hypothetical protein